MANDVTRINWVTGKWRCKSCRAYGLNRNSWKNVPRKFRPCTINHSHATTNSLAPRQGRSCTYIESDASSIYDLANFNAEFKKNTNLTRVMFGNLTCLWLKLIHAKWIFGGEREKYLDCGINLYILITFAHCVRIFTNSGCHSVSNLMNIQSCTVQSTYIQLSSFRIYLGGKEKSFRIFCESRFICPVTS